MKYGAKTDRRYTDEVLRLRTEERLSMPQIAKRLDLTIGWVQHRLRKFDLTERISIVASAENLDRARAMRAEGKRWKTIAKELGVEKWESLARAIYVEGKKK